MIVIPSDSSAEDVVRAACALLFRGDRVEPVFERLRAMHAGRPYHGLAHIASMVRGWASLAHTLRSPLTVLLAILLHDAVYDARAPHGASEEASARLCEELSCDLADPSLAAPAAAMIRATADHETEDADCAALIDLDLAILSAAPDVFDDYDAAVRLEYGHVSDAEWRAGRAAALRRFLERKRIYRTPGFADREAPARSNLRRTIARLGGDRPT